MNLIEKRVLEDKKKDQEIRSYWIIWASPKSNNKSPYKRHMEDRLEEKAMRQR